MPSPWKPPTGRKRTLAADKILVTVGRKPVTEGWGLEAIDLDRDGPFIRIDDQCRTLDARHLCDRRRDRRTHARASGDGARRDGRRDHRGRKSLMGQDLRSRRLLHRSGDRHRRPGAGRGQIRRHRDQDRRFSLSGERPRHDHGEGSGLHPGDRESRQSSSHRNPRRRRRHLGVAAGFSLAIEMGARLEDVAATIHPHPTRSEAFLEASLRALGHPIHI